MKFKITLKDKEPFVEEHPDFQSILDKYGRGNVELIEGIQKNDEE